MGKKIRKLRYSLMISGYAVIIFGLWSIAKYILYFFLKPEFFDRLSELVEINESEEMGDIAAFALITAVLAGMLLLRLFIARQAIRESKGKRAGTLYLLVTALLSCFAAYTLYLLMIGKYSFSVYDKIVSIIVELTYLFVFCDILLAAVRLRWITAKGGKSDAA